MIFPLLLPSILQFLCNFNLIYIPAYSKQFVQHFLGSNSIREFLLQINSICLFQSSIRVFTQVNRIINHFNCEQIQKILFILLRLIFRKKFYFMPSILPMFLTVKAFYFLFDFKIFLRHYFNFNKTRIIFFSFFFIHQYLISCFLNAKQLILYKINQCNYCYELYSTLENNMVSSILDICILSFYCIFEKILNYVKLIHICTFIYFFQISVIIVLYISIFEKCLLCTLS